MNAVFLVRRRRAQIAGAEPWCLPAAQSRRAEPLAREQAGSCRLESLDALRGFNMFWIIGGAELVSAALNATGVSWLRPVSVNLSEHAAWQGFHFYDMIFPLFLFIMGVTTPFSVASRREKGATRGDLVRHTLLRALVLFALGILFNGALELTGWTHLRIMGVLQRLALAWGAATLVYVFFDLRGQVGTAVSVLVLYFLAMRFLPVPGHPLGSWDREGNFANYLDRLVFFPGQLYKEYGDPEGLLSTIPAVSTALLGILAGQWLRTARSQREKVFGLVVAGLVGLALGYAWSPWFPVIKKIWTSSYVLVAGGWSALILAAFYWMVDVRGWRRWAFFFAVIGLNPLTIYLGQELIDFEKIAAFFVGGIAEHAGALVGPLILGLGVMAVKWLMLWFLARRRIYLRI